MTASASLSSENSVSLSMASNAGAANAPGDTGDSASFDDVLQQQEGGSANPTGMNSGSPFDKDNASPHALSSSPDEPSASTAAADDGPAKPAKPLSSEGVSAKGKSSVVSPGSDLSAMMVQAAVLASNAQQKPATNIPVAAASTKPELASAKNPTPSLVDDTDLSTLLAQVLSMAAGAKGSAGKISSKPGADQNEGATPGKNGLQVVSASPDLSTIIAQASILASNAQQIPGSTASLALAAQTSAATGNELPLLGMIKGGAASLSKEKKSASESAEGSFIQSGIEPAKAGLSPLDLLSSSLISTSGSSINQQLTSVSGAKSLPANDLSGGAAAIAGTANVEKGKAMNEDLNFPEVELLSGYGANASPLQAGTEMHIQLGSNNDFQDALKQVLHVAQLTQTSESRTPMRVAIEIQTPPGAIVNVYVSRQNDQWRAQLSTNDPQALSWVQDKMSSLRQSSDLGGEVRWLPPQMETSSSNSGNDSNLSWDRGGQGQSNYQQPDERAQSERQKRAGISPAPAANESQDFMNTMTALGSAA